MEDYEADSPEPHRPGDAAAGDASALPAVGRAAPERAPSPEAKPEPDPEPDPDP